MRSTRIVPKEAALLIDGPFIEGRRPGQPAGPEAEGLAERLQRLYTGIIFDVMRALAIAPGVLPPNISALDPSLKLAGPVWTVHGHLVEGAVPHDTLLSWTRMLSAAPPGSVVVCQPENQEIALMGELSSEAMKSRGVRGYVVDGGCRDTAFIRRLGFPVYCRFTTPRDIVGRWLTDQLGGSVTIGPVTVSTGDFLLADQDGVVVVPGDRAVEVIAAAEEAAAVENKVRTAILDGTDPEQAYLRYGKF
jgi:regulator of RNase E activity RraA